MILADDHALFREGLKSLLKHESNVAIVVTASELIGNAVAAIRNGIIGVHERS